MKGNRIAIFVITNLLGRNSIGLFCRTCLYATKILQGYMLIKRVNRWSAELQFKSCKTKIYLRFSGLLFRFDKSICENLTGSMRRHQRRMILNDWINEITPKCFETSSLLLMDSLGCWTLQDRISAHTARNQVPLHRFSRIDDARRRRAAKDAEEGMPVSRASAPAATVISNHGCVLSAIRVIVLIWNKTF